MTSDRILAAARTWLGTPYHHRARVRGAGVDCLMLIVEAYTATGLLPPDLRVPDYPPDIMYHRADTRYLDAVLDYCDEVDAPQPGDIALFWFGKAWAHGAIVAAWPVVIHAYAPLKRVEEMSVAEDARLARRPVRFFHPREMTS